MRDHMKQEYSCKTEQKEKLGDGREILAMN